jgi:nucleotide-binding universal stress UspA family protein
VIRNVLVPLDGSPFGEHALQGAIRIAGRAGAALHLVHVHAELGLPAAVPGPGAFAAEWEARRRLEAGLYLEKVAAARVRPAGVQAVTQLLDGSFRDALLEYISARGVDLVVMCTHGRGGLSRAWLGSMADALIRAAPVPVLLVRPRDEAGDPAVPVAPATPLHVLVGLDGSGFAEAALEPAIELVGAEGTLTLLQVLAPAYVVGAPFDSTGVMTDPEVQQAQEARCEEYLQDVTRRLAGRVVEVRTRVRTHPQPAVAIARAAADVGADLIAVATHGRGAAARTVLGSVADKVVRGADRPVLVVRPARVAVSRAAAHDRQPEVAAP